MVGDDAGVGNLNGPSGDKLISFSYPVGGVNNIVFYNPTSTTPTNAKINYIGVNWTHQVAVGLYIVLQKIIPAVCQLLSGITWLTQEKWQMGTDYMKLM